MQKPSLQLLSIPEETSSVTDQDFEEIKSPTEVNKHQGVEVKLNRQNLSQEPS